MPKPPFILLIIPALLAIACSADNKNETSFASEEITDSLTVDDYQIINSTLVHLVLKAPEEDEREFGYDNFTWDEEKKAVFKEHRRKLHFTKYLINPHDSIGIHSFYIDPKKIAAANDVDYQPLIRELAKSSPSTLELDLQKITNTGLFDLVSIEKGERIDYDTIEKAVTYSRIIYNDSKDKAVFYFENLCGGFCSYGLIVLVEKENDVWAIKQEILDWIS